MTCERPAWVCEGDGGGSGLEALDTTGSRLARFPCTMERISRL